MVAPPSVRCGPQHRPVEERGAAGAGGEHDGAVVHDPAPRPAAPQPAQRSPASGWRDPRLWAGVLLVAACGVLGARVLDAADDTVEVWAVAADLGAGDEVGADDLVATPVLLGRADGLDHYVEVTEELPADLTLTRGLGAGELLPRSALGDPTQAGTVQIAVAVDDVRVPSSVGAGSVVDVYLLSGGAATDDGTEVATSGDEGGGGGSRRGDRVLEDVTVVASSAEQDFATLGQRKLELAVPAAEAPSFFALLAGSSEPVLSVARQS